MASLFGEPNRISLWILLADVGDILRIACGAWLRGKIRSTTTRSWPVSMRPTSVPINCRLSGDAKDRSKTGAAAAEAESKQRQRDYQDLSTDD